ncbi:MAG: transglycosylase SLT domain-containing protein [Acetobacter aceti]|uniref:transglycosylase SLT domain-containing protein n=1 Tax=Acetobacter aceti TaxID=435 RepID=UPI001F36F3EA|nr:transglycosylase SLT domain-containing protein [Acetobacter aceti]
MSRGQAVIFRSVTLGVMLGLAACSGGSRPGGSPSQWGRGDYTPPGPPSDPWGPYIREAANRFTVPEPWVRAVMHQESGGHEYQNGHLTRSGSGAMGLMQLMPATWSELAAEFGLGNDPYEPHDNIMAGTGYIRQLYDKFGSPGFLAAYNAGPGRLEQYLETGGSLPDETVNYVASISPHLGDAVPAVTTPASPVMVARARAVPAYTVAQNTVATAGPVARTSDGCLRNVDAAYDPSNCLVDRDVPHADPEAPLAPPQPAVEVASAPPVAVRSQTLPAELASYVEPASAHAAAPYRLTPVTYTHPASSGGGWAVQVGAFSSGSDARVALAQAQAIIGRNSDASPVVTKVSPTANSLYRARLVGFAAQDATTACRILHSHSVACFAVPQST